MTVLDSKRLKKVGHFEENKFSVGSHQFLLECCPKLIKTYNFGQNACNKSQFKNKDEQYCLFGCLFSKLPILFVRDCRYFLQCIPSLLTSLTQSL